MSGALREPNYHGRKLLRTLKKLRQQNKLTQEQAGERVSMDAKKLNRIERRQLPTYHELVILLDAYGVPSCDCQPYVDLLTLAKQRPWWYEFNLDDVRYIRMEDEAIRKVEFQLGQIPTLLQTEPYARRVIAKQCESLVSNRVAYLMRQQQRLITDPLLEFHALIHESVLDYRVDGAQLTRLVELAELSNVTIQLVPRAHATPGLISSVCLLSFDDPDEPDCVFTESVIGLLEGRDPDQPSKIKRMLSNVARQVTSPDESLTRIRAMAQSRR